MNLILKISFRNLLRQKRRNIFLGTGIAVGVALLIVANSFSTGITDILLNKLVSNIFGHINVSIKEANKFMPHIRDKERIYKIIKESIPEKDLITVEESVGMFGRGIGNGKSDNIVIVGVREDSLKDSYFNIKEGNVKEFSSKEVEYPVIISEKKAKTLNLKVGDTMKVRLNMVTGQMQSASLKIIAVMKNENIFMNIVLFMELEKTKKLIGYKPYETSSYHIILKNPKRDAKKYADIIYSKMRPDIIAIKGENEYKGKRSQGILMPFKNSSELKRELFKEIGVTGSAYNTKSVLISEEYAKKYGIKTGESINFSYNSKFREKLEMPLTVTGFYKGKGSIKGSLVLINEEKIYGSYLPYIPAENKSDIINRKDKMYSYFATEWKLLDRSKDYDSYMKKLRIEKNEGSKRAAADVVTMYEGASNILKMEYVLNLITLVAVIIIFFILLIGVINTLRMTIKERTREIGTVRAIGMQTGDVRNSFIAETVILTIISSAAGAVLSVLIMYPLGKIKFTNVDSALGTLLLDHHLHFKFNPIAVTVSIIFIIFIAAATSYFPARKAAKMAVADALRHYE